MAFVHILFRTKYDNIQFAELYFDIFLETAPAKCLIVSAVSVIEVDNRVVVES